MKTLVIGLGNPILTDDAAGILAAHLVHCNLPVDAGIDVVDASVGGLALMELMIGYEQVILIDSMWASERETGQVIVFDAGTLVETLNTRSTHDVDLSTALRVGRSLGAPLPLDELIQIVAITAHNVLTFGETPTPPVAAAIPHAASKVLNLLGYPAAESVVPRHS